MGLIRLPDELHVQLHGAFHRTLAIRIQIFDSFVHSIQKEAADAQRSKFQSGNQYFSMHLQLFEQFCLVRRLLL